MKTIIFANPNPKSFTYAIKDSISTFLTNNKEKFETLDLYSKDEYKIIGGYTNNSIMEIQFKISKSNELIFIHPLYWINMPAIMKNFFEQIFTEGFTYNYVGENRDFVPLLENIKAHVIITGNGRREEYEDFNGRTDFEIVWADMLQASGITPVIIEYIGGMDRMTDSERKNILESFSLHGKII